MLSESQSQDVAAFFDVDGTIVEATVVHYYAFFATYGYSSIRRAAWTAVFLPKVVYYLLLDMVSRSRFNRVFYDNYRGMDAALVGARSADHFEQFIRPRMFSGAIDRIVEHRTRGERVVLITGSLDFIMEPVAAFLNADGLIAARMHEQNGRLTGTLTGPPIGDEEKARVMQAYAEEQNIDLDRSYGYADSSSDLPMLRSVGRATVVNPKDKLRRIAEAQGWGIERWTPSST